MVGVLNCATCGTSDPKHLFTCKNCPCAFEYEERVGNNLGIKFDDEEHRVSLNIFVCSRECQKEFWDQHKKEHKFKREAEAPSFVKIVEKEPQWFVDVYRLRLDDDYAFGDWNLHGMYDVESLFGKEHGLEKAIFIIKDFIVFVLLAVHRGEITAQPDDVKFWEGLQVAAEESLQYAFEECDCEKTWGPRAALIMRASADKIYGISALHIDIYEEEEGRNMKHKVESQVGLIFDDFGKSWYFSMNWKVFNHFWYKAIANNLLNEIGGAKIYQRIAETMAKVMYARQHVKTPLDFER